MTSPEELRGLADNHKAISDSFGALIDAAMAPFRVFARRGWAAPWRPIGRARGA